AHDRGGAPGAARAGGAHHEGGGAPDPGRLATLTRLGRRRGRLLVSTVSVLLVLALGGAAYVVYGPDDDDGVRTSGTAAGGVRRVALPAGWRPWEVMLQATGTTPKGPARAAPLGEIFEPQCMTGGDRLFCGGMGFPTVRLDPRSGSLLWRTDALADPSEMTNSSHPVALTADRVFVHDAPNGETTRLVALDAATGHEVWSREVSDSTDAALVGDLVVSSAPDDASLVARAAGDGARRWSYPVPPGQSCNAAGHAGAVYALCWDEEGGDRTSAARLDLATGDATVLARLRGVDAPIGVDDGDLVFLRYRGGAGAAYRSLLRIDVDTGARREVRLPRLALGDATLAAGRLFFIQSSGRVTALDARTGQTLWSNPSDVERLGAPTVSVRENTVYLCNGSGRMLALDLRTGEERWQSGPRSADSGYGMGDETSKVVRVGGALVAAASDGTLFSADPDAPDARP
ncbi:PQQ-binding-like beta-propeller repeat protein, partial [Streptomyces sp. 796.1]|uniref:PQQ-binding-like beta-propeller repeat protein n=1 Tax=Streptomyces sp. 796.1 TaxID=3163029 RepID=UPI0039C95B42